MSYNPADLIFSNSSLSPNTITSDTNSTTPISTTKKQLVDVTSISKSNELLKEGGCLLLTCYFINDGAGDLLNYLDFTDPKLLKEIEELNHYKIIRLILCPREREKELTFRLNKLGILKECHIVYYTATNLEPNLALEKKEFLNYLRANPSFKNELSEVTAVISIPTPRMERGILDLVGIKKSGAIPFLTVGEHGASCYNPKLTDTNSDSVLAYTNNRSYRHMGFSYQHHGIFIKPTDPSFTKAMALCSISDHKFLRLLFNQKKEKFTTSDAVDFLSKSLIVPVYYQLDCGSFESVLQGVAASEVVRKSQYEEIVFVVNQGNVNRKEFIRDYLVKNGVRSIEVGTLRNIPQGNQSTKLVIQKDPIQYFAGSGIKIRVIEGYVLEDDLDYERLVQSAQLFYGCSGDKSLELAIRFRLFPLLQPKQYKLNLLEDLNKLVNQLGIFPEADQVNHMYRSLCPSVYQEAGYNMFSPSIVSKTLTLSMLKNWTSVLDVLHRDYNFYNVIPLLYKQTLYSAHGVQLAKKDPLDPRIPLLTKITNDIDIVLAKKSKILIENLMDKLKKQQYEGVLVLEHIQDSKILIEILKEAINNPAITGIVLENLIINNEVENELIRFLGKVKLTTFSCQNIKFNRADAVLKSLFNHPLKSLQLIGCPITTESLEPLQSILMFNSTLEILQLPKTGLDDNAAELIAKSLLNNKNLHSVSLMHNNITDIGANKFAGLLQRFNLTLTELSLEFNSVNDKSRLDRIKSYLMRNKYYRDPNSVPKTILSSEGIIKEFKEDIERIKPFNDVIKIYTGLKKKN